eukprot:388517-Pelagomonas_calceolata.AAC.1
MHTLRELRLNSTGSIYSIVIGVTKETPRQIACCIPFFIGTLIRRIQASAYMTSGAEKHRANYEHI